MPLPPYLKPPRGPQMQAATPSPGAPSGLPPPVAQNPNSAFTQGPTVDYVPPSEGGVKNTSREPLRVTEAAPSSVSQKALSAVPGSDQMSLRASAGKAQYDTDPFRQYQDLLAQQKKGLGDVMNQADMAAARNSRRGAEMASMAGAQFGGGGFQASQATQALGGQELRMKAQQDYNKQNMQIRLGWLDQMLKSDQAVKDKDFEREMQKMRGDIQLQLGEMDAAEKRAERDAAAAALEAEGSGGGLVQGITDFAGKHKGATAGGLAGLAVGGPVGAAVGLAGGAAIDKWTHWTD